MKQTSGPCLAKGDDFSLQVRHVMELRNQWLKDRLAAVNSLLETPESAALGERTGDCNPTIARSLESEFKNTESLTGRECEVLKWLQQGKTSPEIAIILGCAARTVEKHVQNLYRKLGIKNRTSIILNPELGRR